MQIHELPAQTTAADTDVVAIDNGTTTQKMTVANLGKKITEDATPAFTSGDSSTATSWTNVTAVTSGLSLKNILNRITTMMKNVRFLYNKLGTTDISSVGGGTVTGAISKLNADIARNGTNGQVSIKAYTSGTAPYVFPSDGYVLVGSGTGNSAGAYIRVAIRSNNNINAASIYMNITGSYQYQVVFVKKGMFAFVAGTSGTGSDWEAVYIPLDA